MIIHRFGALVLCMVVMTLSACVAPDDVETGSAALSSDELRASDLVAELLHAQRPQPIVKEPELEAGSEIEYTCDKDLDVLASSESCETDPANARCASIDVGRATLTLDKPNSGGCSTRRHCRWDLDTGIIWCRTCKTCCSVRNGSTTCQTACGKDHWLIME